MGDREGILSIPKEYTVFFTLFFTIAAVTISIVSVYQYGFLLKLFIEGIWSALLITYFLIQLYDTGLIMKGAIDWINDKRTESKNKLRKEIREKISKEYGNSFKNLFESLEKSGSEIPDDLRKKIIDIISRPNDSS